MQSLVRDAKATKSLSDIGVSLETPLFGRSNRIRLGVGAMGVIIFSLCACRFGGSAGDYSIWPHVVKLNEKCGYIDKQGNTVIDPQFDSAWNFDVNGLAPVAIGGAWGFIDTNGKIIVNPQFENAGGFNTSDLAPIKKDGRWGYIDEDGKIVIEPQFETAWEFQNNSAAVVEIGSKLGLINKYGKYIVVPQFDKYQTYDVDRKVYILEKQISTGGIESSDVSLDGRIGPHGLENNSAENDQLSSFSEEGKWGLRGSSGETVVDPIYDRPIVFSGKEQAWFTLGNRFGIIDKKGQYVIGPILDNVRGYAPSSDTDLAPVSSNGKWGYIDKSGRFVIPPRYEDARDFEEFKGNYASVGINGKYGIIDRRGNLVVPAKFDFIGICLQT